jgi:hypothetical protein
MDHAYRSDYQQIITQRITSMRRSCELLDDSLPELNRIRRARLARIAAGVAGIAGMALTVLFACTDSGELPTVSLLGSSVLAFATYGVARLILRFSSKIALTNALPALSGDLRTDIAELDAHDPAAGVLRRLSELETWSIALPMSATSLLAPLTLHWLFVMMIGKGVQSFDFASWIRISLVVVGHAHLALIALSIGFAQRMHQASLEEVKSRSPNLDWAKAWGLTIAVAAMPGVLLLCFPPLIAAVTGILFIPAMFVLARRCMIAERTTVEMANQSTVRIAADAAPIPMETELDELVKLEESPLASVARY